MDCYFCCLVIAILVCFIDAGQRTILATRFLKFVEEKYDEVTAKKFVRSDINGVSSFGGDVDEFEERPIVLVHGLRHQAGNLWNIRKTFVEKGFPRERIFATTYGPGATRAPLFDESMKCAYVKQIRQFILSVNEFTKTKVNVIGYSMGFPIARKAIKGGRCVDTGEDLGPPITDKVQVFLSVAGANHGSFLCFPSLQGICSVKNGLFCFSEYITDINSSGGYEGAHRISLWSTSDEVVGAYSCGQKTSMFPSAREVTVDNRNHENLMFETGDLQLRLIREKQ